ncbi:SRPBCC family protein [Pedosphaera parvula]|nr:SRPBCC family protein [Pedosphaera parvula]
METKTKKKAPPPAVPSGKGKKVVKACTIRKSAPELYGYWRQFENLPGFTKHLFAVTQISNVESHWVAKSPTGDTLEWDAVIINEHPNEMIAWESVPDSQFRNAGSVRFKPAPAGQGTEVTVSFEYVPPGGALGEAVAKLYGEEPDLMVEDDLCALKALMETGEIPTTEGQPAGGRQKAKEEERRGVE